MYSKKLQTKPITLTKAKKKAWDAFSKYIRLRDCLRTTGTKEFGKCVTCQKTYSFKQLHAGHFIPGRSGENLFDERGVHAQCGICNLWKKGDWANYLDSMKVMYGQEIIDELLEQRHQTKKYTVSELLEKEAEYSKKYMELL